MAKKKRCVFPAPDHKSLCGRKGYGGFPICEAHQIVIRVMDRKIKELALVSQSAEDSHSNRDQ